MQHVAKVGFMELKRITVYIPAPLYSLISSFREREGYQSDSSVIRHFLHIALVRIYGDDYGSLVDNNLD